MTISIVEVCTRLKWYLKLCEEYRRFNNIIEKSDYYIARYIVVAIYTIIFSNIVLHSSAINACKQDVLKKLEELGVQFLYARYSYTDDLTVLNMLKLLCPCLSTVISLLC